MDKYVTTLTNLAVIAGLIFLVLEIRQNNEMMVLEARQGISDARNDLVLTNMNSPSLITARGKAERGEELTYEEKQQYLRFFFIGEFFAVFRNWQDQFLSYQAGAITESHMESEAKTWRQTINRAPYIQAEWQCQRGTLTPDFVAFMEASG